MRDLIILILIVISFGCKPKNGYFKQNLNSNKTIEFVINDSTSNQTSRVQLIEINGIEQFQIWSNFTNTLYFYDHNTQVRLDKFHFETEGPNGIGNPKNFVFINEDSIIFSDDNAINITITDLKNKKTTKVGLIKYDKSTRGEVPHVQDNFPILYKNKKISLVSPFTFSPYAISAPEEFKKIENSCFNFEFDLSESKKIEPCINFPYEYSKEVYSRYFYLVSQIHNENDETIYSFSLSDSLFVKDKEGKTRSYLARTNTDIIKKSIASNPKSVPRGSNEFEFETFMESTNYDKILYDKYRNRYYRFVEYPIAKEKRNLNFPQRIKPLGVIVLDESFNFIEEYFLGYGKYTTSKSFISKNGLNLNNHEVNSNNENLMSFDVFEF